VLLVLTNGAYSLVSLVCGRESKGASSGREPGGVSGSAIEPMGNYNLQYQVTSRVIGEIMAKMLSTASCTRCGLVWLSAVALSPSLSLSPSAHPKLVEARAVRIAMPALRLR
jgi:hypothetical protein